MSLIIPLFDAGAVVQTRRQSKQHAPSFWCMWGSFLLLGDAHRPDKETPSGEEGFQS